MRKIVGGVAIAVVILANANVIFAVVMIAVAVATLVTAIAADAIADKFSKFFEKKKRVSNFSTRFFHSQKIKISYAVTALAFLTSNIFSKALVITLIPYSPAERDFNFPSALKR